MAIRIDSLPGLPPVLGPDKNLDIRDMEFVEKYRELEDVRSMFPTSTCHACELRDFFRTSDAR